MYSIGKPLGDRFYSACFALAIGLLLLPTQASAQIRTKAPDRGIYQSPRLQSVAIESADHGDEPRSGKPRHPQSPSKESQVAEEVPVGGPIEPTQRTRELVEVTLDIHGQSTHGQPTASAPIDRQSDAASLNRDAPALQQVGHQDVILVQRQAQHTMDEESIVQIGPATVGSGVIWDDANVIHDGTCDGCPGGCEANHCDSIGCDSIGCDSPWYRNWNSSLCFDSNGWFGSIELLLMFRKGERLPPLVTTGPAANPDTAGQLDQANTQVLVGGDTILSDMTAGGRLTLGTWLDSQQCQSLVFRGWFAGEETFGFNANQDQFDVLARPFLNVSDNSPPEQDVLLIAFPNRASGGVNVSASSDVFGGDISIRQFWYGKYGGTVDLLYGYQYMRLDEDLSISSTSTSLDDDFAPIGSVISVVDTFDTDNEFHGGQLGIASRYRERCWSFNGLAKVGFGSLRRRAQLSGATLTSIDGANAVDPNGLLVRSTNAGTTVDNTFGWVPELDLTLGWHQYPRFDLTLGYHIIAMTDAVQSSAAIDPNLAVNLSDPPMGLQRPEALLRYDTFYVHGIHFGLQHVY